MLRNLILQLQEPKDVFFRIANDVLAFPSLLPTRRSFHRRQSMIRQIVPFLLRKQPHRPVEEITPRKVQNGIGELFLRIVLEIDASMKAAVELAHSHVVVALVVVVHAGEVEVVGEQADLHQSLD